MRFLTRTMTNGATMTERNALQRLGRAFLPAVAVGAVVACDTTVTNPGPVQDEFLDSLNAHVAVVTGTKRDLADAIDQTNYWGAAMTFEINPAGSTGSFGIPQQVQAGRFDDDYTDDWNATQRARWTAENAFERFSAALPEIEGAPAIGSYAPAGEALLFAGYANRLLGENFCQVVFDGGAPQAHTDAFARARDRFAQAATIAGAANDDDTRLAALAGQASVVANLATYGLADWGDAADLAGQVANAVDEDWTYDAIYSAQDQDQYNYLFWANGNEPYRAHTVWGTYWDANPDPRVPYDRNTGLTGDAGVDKFGGNVPWYPQEKYDARDAGIPLSSYWEMRLIQAEAELAAGDFDGAEPFLNERRQDLNLTDYDFANVAEGYRALYVERAAELWLQARRMGDIRRWLENGASVSDFTDGNYADQDQNLQATPVEDLSTRFRAYPIGESERETNPGVPLEPVFCN